jgi:cardiolipin synthase
MSESSVEIISAAVRRAAPAAAPVVVGDNRVRFLRDGAEGYPAMLAAIGAARTEVVFEMYWFGSDAVGRIFVDALIARAHAGVVVRVIFDAVGSAPIDMDMFDELRAAGGDVRIFNPLLRLWRRMIPRWVRRDHRKILVCDGEVGFTGGLNIGRPWAPRDQGGEGWRDDVVEVTGPSARELRTVFYESWRRLLKRKERTDPSRMPNDAKVLTSSPPDDVWVIANRRKPSRRAIRATYLRWIHRATKAIDLVNAYFVPDLATRRALLYAVRRGVRVRVVVPQDGDVPLVQWAVEATVERLVRRGVEVFAYRDSVLHSKSAVVDDDLVTIGSYNLDARSFRYNQEVNVAARSVELATIVRHAIEDDIAKHCVRWTYETLRGRGWLRRWFGEIARLFARFL